MYVLELFQPDYTVTMSQLFDGVLLPGDDILFMTETTDNTTCGVRSKYTVLAHVKVKKTRQLFLL